MESEILKRILDYCGRKMENGESIDPCELKEKIEKSRKRIEVATVEEAHYVRFDDGDICNNLNGFMSGVDIQIYDGYGWGDEPFAAIESKYKQEWSVEDAAERILEEFPHVKVVFLRDGFDDAWGEKAKTN